MKNTFVINYLPEAAKQYAKEGWAIVAIDVIRATTLAVTAVSLGRKCFPVDSVESAKRMAQRLLDPLLAGEVNGVMPDGFEMNNSPAELVLLEDSRPLIMLSSSGTRLLANARGCDILYLSCFRNSGAVADRLAAGEHAKIALIGAGSRGEFREEDQIGCAWIGRCLLKAGYASKNAATTEVVKRWGEAKAAACLVSHSVEYLRRTNQIADLDFILEHVDDLDEVFVLRGHEVLPDSAPSTAWQSDFVPATDAI